MPISHSTVSLADLRKLLALVVSHPDSHGGVNRVVPLVVHTLEAPRLLPRRPVPRLLCVGAEVSWLVHVDPQSVEINHLQGEGV